MTSYVLAIDQGTTSTRAILFRADTSIASFAQQEFPQHFPADGEVEHEPEDLWTTTLATCRDAMRQAGAGAKDIAAIGITNQRETTLLWDRSTGRPVHRAIVWQDRRTADMCARLKRDGHEPTFTAKTGLLLDPYFSGTKLAWLLKTSRDRRARRARRTRLRHSRHVSAVAAHRRQSARHRRDQRVAYAVVRHSQGRWDDELIGVARRAEERATGVRDSFGRLRHDRPGAVWRGHPDLRHRRRSAGGSDRPGLFCSRHGQIDLRHRLLRADQHRARRRSLPTTSS